MADSCPALRVLIVDDEPLARERARRLLDRLDGIEIIGEAATGGEALKRIERDQPDVVLLDIQMPDLDGMRVLEALDDPPAVIFSTAYEHHAVRAFELDAVDYLLKPYSAERLARALDRARRQISLSAPATPPADAEDAAPGPLRIPAENGRRTELLPVDHLSAARIEEGVVFLLRDDGERLIYAESLNDLEESLASSRCLRINRQTLVNLDAVEAVEPHRSGGLLLHLRGGHKEVVSRRRTRHVKHWLRKTKTD